MIEADRNYVVIRVGKDSYHARSTLQQAELALRSQPMLRISRSCLVNMNYVKEVNRTLRGDFILVLGRRRHGDEQRRISRQGQGLPGHAANFAVTGCVTSSSSGANGARSFSAEALQAGGFRVRVPGLLRPRLAARPLDLVAVIRASCSL